MNIRTPDAKGRITVGENGQPYSVTRNSDGSIILSPITVPAPPTMDRQDMRGVYIDVGSGRGLGASSAVTIYSNMSPAFMAELAVQVAKSEMLPIVVDTTGTGAMVYDMVVKAAEGQVDASTKKRPIEVLGVNAGRFEAPSR